MGLAAGALWWFANTIGKTTEHTQVDTRTGMPARLASKHTLFFLPPVFWAVVMTCIAVSSVVSTALKIASRPMSAKERAFRAFEDANSLIISSRQGIAHGNNEAAKELATAFSQALKVARSLGVEKSSSTSIVSLTKGQFPTYCLLTPRRCVFMVHVPELRHFSSEAKAFVADAACMITNQIVTESGIKPDSLLIGIRGSLFYDRVIIARGGLQLSSGRAIQGDESKRELITEFAAAAAETKESSSEAESSPKEKAGVKTAKVTTPSPAAQASLADTPPPAQALVAPMPATPASPVAKSSAVQPLHDMRTWTDTTGRAMKAAFVRFTSPENITAEFKREDGQTFVVPLQRFSAEDQSFMKDHPDLNQ